MTINERVRKITNWLIYTGFASSGKDVAIKLKYQPSSFSQILNGKVPVSKKFAIKLATAHKNINLDWILTGEGEMLLSTDSLEKEVGSANDINNSYMGSFSKEAMPYYEQWPFSLKEGKMIISEKRPAGYIKVPNLKTLCFFPAIGFSMQPEINPGNILGVNLLEDWCKVDPDKIYLVVAGNDKYIKRLRTDHEDASILWAISSNYPEFKLQKGEIDAIFQIVFKAERL